MQEVLLHMNTLPQYVGWPVYKGTRLFSSVMGPPPPPTHTGSGGFGYLREWLWWAGLLTST